MQLCKPRNIPHIHSRPKIAPIAKLAFKTAGQDQIYCHGVVSLKFSINGSCFEDEFYVFNDITQAIILGVSFFQKYGCTLDFESHTMSFMDEVPVQVISREIFMPGEIKNIRVKLDQSSHVMPSGMNGMTMDRFVRDDL